MVVAALTSTRTVEILVQIQNLPHIHQALLEPHGHQVAIQLRAQKPLPLPLLVVVVLGVHVLGPAGTRPRILRRRSTARRPLEVGRGVGNRHLVHLGAPAGEFVQPGEGVAEVGGTRHGVAPPLAQPRRPRGRAVDDPAADAGGVVARGALGSVRVSGAHGEGAVPVVEVGWIAPGGVAAGTAGPEGGAAVVVGVAGSLHCS